MEAQLLRQIIKDSIREVLQEERLSLFLALIPFVNEKEMQEIESKFPSPKEYNRDEFIDMTEWVKS
jgi:hypothetical protein